MTGDDRITTSTDERELLCQLRTSWDALIGYSRNHPTFDSDKTTKIEGDIEQLIRASGTETPLCYLKDKALVTDAPCRKVPAHDRQQRRGRYPYYVRGFIHETIDDYTLDGSYLLVGSLGTIETQRRRLVVLSCLGKGMPSELFHVVIPDNPGDIDYLYHVLRATMAPPLMVGTTIVREIPRTRLENVLVPWPDVCVRDAFVSIHTMLDELSERHASGATPIDIETLELIGAARDVLGTYYLSSTHHPETLRHEFHVDRDTKMDTNRATHGAERSNTGDDSPPPSENPDDPPCAVLDLIESLIRENAPDDAELLDVVSETPHLEDGRALHRADVCICIPEPNQGEWTTTTPNRNDSRWVLGVPPRNKANFAWIMQAIGSLSDHGVGLLLLCNGPLISNIGIEQHLRRTLAYSGLVQCVISLPGGIFADGRPPTSLVIVEKGRTPGSSTLFINLQECGKVASPAPAKTIRVVPDGVIAKTIDVYRTWNNQMRGFQNAERYEDVPGLCASVGMADIEKRDGTLAPWIYT